MCRRRRADRPLPPGFTLVEILMVVAILGIAAAMIIPRLTGTGDIQAVSAARLMLADIQYAQNQAIVTQRDITVSVDAAHNGYSLRDPNGLLTHPVTKRPYAVSFAAMQGLDKVRLLPPSLREGTQVTFDAMGAPKAGGGTIALWADGYQYEIAIADVTGRTSVRTLNH